MPTPTRHPKCHGRPMLAVKDGYTRPLNQPDAPIWYCPDCGKKLPREPKAES